MSNELRVLIVVVGMLPATACDTVEVAFPCDGVWYPDLDDDGYGDDSQPDTGCAPESYGVAVGGDCDDGDPNLNPATIWYEDRDGDGAASTATSATWVGCEPPEGYTRHLGDPDDDDASVR